MKFHNCKPISIYHYFVKYNGIFYFVKLFISDRYRLFIISNKQTDPYRSDLRRVVPVKLLYSLFKIENGIDII